MRILSIGNDRKLCDGGSAVLQRQKNYASKCETLDIITFSRKDHDCKAKSEYGNLTIYATLSKSKFYYIPDAIWRARSLKKADVVMVQDPFESGLPGLIVSRLWNVPLYVQLHTSFDAHVRGRGFVWRIIGSIVLKRAARIRVVLQSDKELLEGRGISAPITVLPIYVDVGRFRKVERMKHPVWDLALLSIGRFEKEKNMKESIGVLAKIREVGYDAGLTLVGDGREKGELEKLAQKRGVEKYVKFAGWQDNILPFLSVADAVVVPSLYEGYGMAIIEALAAGVPVISYDVGVAKEAGAIIAERGKLTDAVEAWIRDGKHGGVLAATPYQSEGEYNEKIVDDIQRCLS